MPSLTRALIGAASAAPSPAGRADVLLLLGGGGVLGSALLARALGSGRFGRVQALVAKDIASALRVAAMSAACLAAHAPWRAPP